MFVILKNVTYVNNKKEQLSEFSYFVFVVDDIVYEPSNQNFPRLIDYKAVEW